MDLNEPGIVRRMMVVLGQHRRKILLLLALLSAASIYRDPQGFIDLWLTRDQQARIHFDRGDYDKAAATFRDQRWIAYSHYGAGNFEEAAAIYGQLDSTEDLFAQANALAHNGQFYMAKERYQQILNLLKEHLPAKMNLRQVTTLIEQLPANPDEAQTGSSQTNLDEPKKNKQAKKQTAVPIPEMLLTDELWLEQVQQDPSFFLQKKFHQDYVSNKQQQSKKAQQ